MKVMVIIAALTLLAAAVQTEPAPLLNGLPRVPPGMTKHRGGWQGIKQDGQGLPPNGLFKTNTHKRSC